MRDVAMRVGVLAERSGVSVRALHYYDEIGLLSPTGRSATGHRLYDASDIARLQQIRSLGHLGFGLKEIAELLRQPDRSPKEIIEAQRTRIDAQIATLNDLRERLYTLATMVEAADTPTVDALLGVLEVMSRMERYYSPEQRDWLEKHRQQVGDDRSREVEVEWPAMMEQVRAEMERGTDPADPRVRALARRWSALVTEFTDGAAGIEQRLGAMWRQEETIHGTETAAMRELGAYLGLASPPKSEGA